MDVFACVPVCEINNIYLSNLLISDLIYSMNLPVSQYMSSSCEKDRERERDGVRVCLMSCNFVLTTKMQTIKLSLEY